jgi:engulfment and cell motility protein 1
MQYRQVRERQMKELELQDDLLNKPPIRFVPYSVQIALIRINYPYHRNLRAKLHKESYEFVRQQRIMCMMQGAWFANGIPIPTSDQGQGRDSVQLKRPSRPWRFYRLVSSLLVIEGLL